jgi:hypothetical protein
MRDHPFIGTEALNRGQVSRRALRGRHQAVYRNVYLPTGCQLTAVTRAAAAWLWSSRTATAVGLSAAALHGSQWIDPQWPAELCRRNGKPVDGIVIHRGELLDGEVCTARGTPVTTPARTAFDLGRRQGLTTAVIRLDALANATNLHAGKVSEIARRHPGARGVVQLRRVLLLMDGGAESPQETRTRLLLVRAGLPAPLTQIPVCDPAGVAWARIDMGYPQWMVGIEYDGAQHWTDSPARSPRHRPARC